MVRDLSHLPKAPPQRDEGWPPDASPRFGIVLVEKWHQEGIERDLHFRDGQTARFFHSSAAGCSRAVAYAALKVPESNPIDAPGHFITHQGQWLHDELQAAVQAAYPGAQIEVEVSAGDGMGGHADIEVTDTQEIGTDNNPDVVPYLISIEAKSIDGYAYKAAVGERAPAEGPKHEHIVQASLNGRASNADEIVILYLTRGAVSVGAAKRAKIPLMQRVTAEWTIDRATYEPIADREIARINGILALLDEGTLPARKIPTDQLPVGHVIKNPHIGEWTATLANGKVTAGKWWACDYCRWQDTCSLTEMGRSPVSQLVEIGVLS